MCLVCKATDNCVTPTVNTNLRSYITQVLKRFQSCGPVVGTTAVVSCGDTFWVHLLPQQRPTKPNSCAPFEFDRFGKVKVVRGEKVRGGECNRRLQPGHDRLLHADLRGATRDGGASALQHENDPAAAAADVQEVCPCPSPGCP